MRCFLCGTLLISHIASNVKENGCKRCFPDYGEGVEVSKNKDVFSPESTIRQNRCSSTPVHHARKNVGCKGRRCY